MKARLQATLTRIKAAQANVIGHQKNVVGLTLAVSDLTKEVIQEGLTAKARQDTQKKLDKETQKLSEAQDRVGEAEQELGDLVAEKAEIMRQLAEIQGRPPRAEGGDEAVVQGSQLASIPTFDGSATTDGEAWIRMVDRAMEQFGWTSRQTAQAVRNKMTGEARLFVDNQEDEGLPGTNTWNEGGDNLRKMLLDKYGFTYSAATAAHALEDLKQSTNETVDQFYERTRFAVSKFLSDMDKDGPHRETYQSMFRRLTFTHFKGGMFQQYRQAIYSAVAARQPTTPRALLEAARSAELEAGKSRKDVMYKKVAETILDEKDEEPEAEIKKDEDKTPEAKSLDATVAELAKEVEMLRQGGRGRGGRGRGRGGRGGRGGGRGRGACHGCGKNGHWWKQCFKNPNRQAPRPWQPWPQGAAAPANNPFMRPPGNRMNEMAYDDSGAYEALN